MIRRSLVICGILFVSTGLSIVAYDRDEFLFLDEIEIGMRGIGKTVVANDEVSEFAADVLGVIDNPGTLSDFIVVRVSGEAIGRSGGIAQGMSGSPIYVGGKLIGALSRAASWSKEITPIGLVTPIEPMLAVIDATNEAETRDPNAAAVLRDVQVVETSSPPEAEVVAAHPGTIFATLVSTPIVTTGLSERSVRTLMDGVPTGEFPAGLITDFLFPELAPHPRGLSSLNLSLVPCAGQASAGGIDPAALQPGSAIGAALATGDITIGALGTLTYRDEDTLVGFGHNYISNGNSGFPLTTVSIVDTMKSYEASFKLGMLGETIGTVLQDRIPGIGGHIGVAAETIALSLAVTDADQNVTERYVVELVDEPRLMPELLLSTGFEAIDTTLSRIGQGTVEVTYVVDGPGMPSSLDRRDVFISTRDIAVYPPLQLAGIVALMQYNEFQDPEIDRIDASMKISEGIDAIRISHLTIDSIVYAPGDMIRFQVELQTYQGLRQIQEGELLIPSDLIADHILVRAYAGPRHLEAGETPEKFESLADLIEAIEQLPNYEVLTVELFAVDPFSSYSDALFGVEEITFEFPGYTLYDEREASAVLIEPAPSPEIEPNW